MKGRTHRKTIRRLATLLLFIPVLLGATASHSSETRLAFLSNSEKDQQPAIEVPTLPPPPEANPFDGRWIFTGGGCRGAGSVAAGIKGGRVIVRGGGGNGKPGGINTTG